MAIYICNSFSLAMLDPWRLYDTESQTKISVQPVDDPISWLSEAESRHGKSVSAVGHADTAALFSNQLGREIELNRSTITLDESNELLIGQLVGGRLPEGATTLPPTHSILWVAVTID